MKRALAALGTFAAIGFAIVLGSTPASAAGCIQGASGCAVITVNGHPHMTHDKGSLGMTHNGIDGNCRHGIYGC